MKPGISSCYFDMLDAYEMAKTFVECGYDQTEINEEHYKCFYREKDVRAYRRYIDELGFFIPQGHLVYMNEGNITSYDNTYAVDRLKKNLEVWGSKLRSFIIPISAQMWFRWQNGLMCGSMPSIN